MEEEIIQNLNERLDRAVEKGKNVVLEEDIHQRIDELRELAETTVRKHPIISIASAFAMGFVLAQLFKSDN